MPLPLDEMVLERFSIAVALLLDHHNLPLPTLGDPALVELVLSDSAGEAERSRALHLLGVRPTTILRVLAVKGTPNGLSAALGSLHAVLVTTDEIPPQQGDVGVSTPVPAIEAPAAWRSAPYRGAVSQLVDRVGRGTRQPAGTRLDPGVCLCRR